MLFSFAETCQGNPGSKRYKFALTHYQDQSVRMNVPLALCLWLSQWVESGEIGGAHLDEHSPKISIKVKPFQRHQSSSGSLKAKAEHLSSCLQFRVTSSSSFVPGLTRGKLWEKNVEGHDRVSWSIGIGARVGLMNRSVSCHTLINDSPVGNNNRTDVLHLMRGWQPGYVKKEILYVALTFLGCRWFGNVKGIVW